MASIAVARGGIERRRADKAQIVPAEIDIRWIPRGAERPLVIGISFHVMRTLGFAPFSSSFFAICSARHIAGGPRDRSPDPAASPAASHEAPGLRSQTTVCSADPRGSGAFGFAL